MGGEGEATYWTCDFSYVSDLVIFPFLGIICSQLTRSHRNMSGSTAITEVESSPKTSERLEERAFTTNVSNEKGGPRTSHNSSITVCVCMPSLLTNCRRGYGTIQLTFRLSLVTVSLVSFISSASRAFNKTICPALSNAGKSRLCLFLSRNL